MKTIQAQMLTRNRETRKVPHQNQALAKKYQHQLKIRNKRKIKNSVSHLHNPQKRAKIKNLRRTRNRKHPNLKIRRRKTRNQSQLGKAHQRSKGQTHLLWRIQTSRSLTIGPPVTPKSITEKPALCLIILTFGATICLKSCTILTTLIAL